MSKYNNRATKAEIVKSESRSENTFEGRRDVDVVPKRDSSVKDAQVAEEKKQEKIDPEEKFAITVEDTTVKTRKLDKKERLDKFIKEQATCSFCNVMINGQGYKIEDFKGGFNGEKAYEIKCNNDHSEQQNANLLVAEAPKEHDKEFIQVSARTALVANEEKKQK